MRLLKDFFHENQHFCVFSTILSFFSIFWIKKDAPWNSASIGPNESPWTPIFDHFVQFWIMSVPKQPGLKLKSEAFVRWVGRPRHTWADQLLQKALQVSGSWQNLENDLADKKTWRCLVTYSNVVSSRRLGGIKRQLNPIGKSVSVSFRVRVVRACVHAKLCGCVREVLLNAGGPNGKICGCSSGRDFSFEMLSLLSRVLKIFSYVAAIVVGFKEIFACCCYCRGF